MGFPTKIREIVHQKYGGRCAYCGHEITQRQMQVDHIVPRNRYGTDDLDNLNPSCQPCNNYKGVFDLEYLRTQIAAQVDRARQYSVNFRLSERFGLIELTNAPVVFYFERVESGLKS